jgi:hypothetical protein
MSHSSETVTKILGYLYDRGGFDDWWDAIERGDRLEIENDLGKLIEEGKVPAREAAQNTQETTT